MSPNPEFIQPELSPKLRKQHKTNKIECGQNKLYKLSLRLFETSTSKE